MIYFLQPIDGGPIKIGTSADVDARRKQLESHYGRPLALLATVPGGREQEQAIHDRFAHLRFGRTEQFRPAAELMAFIGRPLLVDANPDAVEAMPPAKAQELEFRTFGFRSTIEWGEWVQRFAKAERTDVAKLIDAALAEYAKVREFSEAPPERIP